MNANRAGANTVDGFDYDWIIVGSGFGGSIAALRLAERGYSVCVLECGRRYATTDLPKSTWNLRKYFWMPKLGLRGILRITMFRDVSIISGAGVGGGSLVYGQTLYRATDDFRQHLNAAAGADIDLDRFYGVAERMLGVADQPRESSRDAMFLATAETLGWTAKFQPTRVGVFFGEPGQTVPDPFFGGEGPERAGCVHCGRCMVGCPHNAKNTLDKNYLHLAERRGVVVMPDRFVTDVRPVGAADGTDGYAVTAQHPGAWARRRRQVLRAKGVVVAGGALGTNHLLATCKHNGSLPALSDRLGADVRTNAESIGALTLRDSEADIDDGVTISGSLFTSANMHFESVTYGGAGDSMGLLFAPLSGDGSRITRPLKLVRQILLQPRDFLRAKQIRGWSKRSMLVGAMWNRDGAIQLQARRRMLGRGIRLRTRTDPLNPNPTYIPEVASFLTALADKYDAIPQLWTAEAFNKPFTAHILGGAVIGADPQNGVVDSANRVFGYQNLLVTDGAAVPYNPGVNPSLTISALAEHAMSLVPNKNGAVHRGGIGFK